MHSDLIARIEGGNGDERALIAEAFAILQPGIDKDDWLELSAGFYQKLNAGAYVDAALTLLPDNWWLTFLGWNDARDTATAVIESFCDNHEGQGRGPTLARAITAACLRARGDTPQ